MMKSSLGDRMKKYEQVSSYKLSYDMPVILRVDGKTFHTYTRGLEKPFTKDLIKAMQKTAKVMCSEMSGCKLAYHQSDEISFLFMPSRYFESEPYFGNKIQKIASVAAGLASGLMTEFSPDVFEGKVKRACFDARVWTLPPHEVTNYFIWRQQDWTRNSIQMLARSFYSHKKLKGLNNAKLQDLCWQKGSNWNDLPTHLKRGSCVIKRTIEDSFRPQWIVDKEIPIFSKDRNYIDDLLIVKGKDEE